MGSEELYNIYRSNQEDGGFVLQNKYPVSTRYYKDEGLDPLTTYYYKLNTLTSGYIGGEVRIQGVDHLPHHGHVPAFHGGKACITLVRRTRLISTMTARREIFLTGYTDEGTEGMVVAIRPDGTEPYDLDGNATSYSGYAEIPWKAEATPVVADFGEMGEQYIISLTRNYNKCDDYVTCYSSLDKDGDKLPDHALEDKHRNDVLLPSTCRDRRGCTGRKKVKEIVFRSEFEKKPIVIMDAHGNIKASFGNLSGDFFLENRP